MNTLPIQENAVAAIRVSSVKQGLQGDSPEDQKEQIERFSKARGINIKKFFIFMESASKEEQPVQEAIDYCKNPKNNIQVFIIKSIDRFTRGGSYLYDHLKMQLDANGIRLIDIYGVISNTKVNTLDHLGVEYDWSVYSPTKKSEILEAERAKDEMRDIMTRMIGAEIRYVRMGYRVRRAPYGYKNEKIETQHGRRVVLVPHQDESVWIKKMFDLRSRGTLNDKEIVKQLNQQGFKTRIFNRRDPNDKTKIIGKIGGKPLRLKQFWRFIRNPIYAGINSEKWTEGNPVKGKFDGLVSIETYNQANRGKVTIVEKYGEVTIYTKKPPEYLTNKQVKNPDFPFKKHVLCPKCKKPLFGSASRGKMGKYYPAYHCNKRGHYFRVPCPEFNEAIDRFVKDLKIKPDYGQKLKDYVLVLWEQRQKELAKDNESLFAKIEALKEQARSIAEKIRFLNSETAIRYMEEDLVSTQQEIEYLEKSVAKDEYESVDMDVVMERIEYFLEHLEELVLDRTKPLKRAEYFSLLFEEKPTYEEIVSGTPNLAPFIAIKDQLEGGLVPFGDPAGI